MTKEERRQYNHDYHLVHIDKAHQQSHEYREIHRDEINQRQRIYCQEHRDKIRQQNRIYYWEHPEQMQQYRLATKQRRHDYSVAHHNEHHVARRKRRALKANAPVSDLTALQWEERVTEFNGYCVYCLKSMNVITQDHMTPLTRSGSHTLSNVIPSCPSCNSKKNKKTLLEYLVYAFGGP